MNDFYQVDLGGYEARLPIIRISENLKIAFFNLHGNVQMTEHAGKAIAKRLADVDVLLTAESKGLQLCHVIAREKGHAYYAVARKTKKLYMGDGVDVAIKSSITTGKPQFMHLSQHDSKLLCGKRVGIIDDVISTGASLDGLVELVEKSGGIVAKKAFCLAEGDAKNRSDIIYLDTIPLFFD